MAGTTDWKIYILEDLSAAPAGQWVIDDSALVRPNVTLGLSRTSTHSTIILDNGDKAIIQPEIKAHFAPIQLVWVSIEDTFKEQWEAYMNNGYQLKITTHNASNEFIGKIAEVSVEWLEGEVSSSGGDLYNLIVIFDRTNTV